MKTEEEVERSLKRYLERLEHLQNKINSAHNAARKLIRAGIEVDMNCGGLGLLFRGGSEEARKICKEFRVKFRKTPDHTGKHIDFDGQMDGVDIHLYGQLPKGCSIIYHTKVVPEHVENIPEIVCKPR